MSEALIRVRGLSKKFRLYDKPSDRFIEWLSLGRSIRHRDFWALRDFSLEVQRGQCVGIIGANGAGKSTLLRIISGTLAATSGDYDIKGRVLSLLELGTGFNPHLTGRQNIVHTAELLGFPPNEAVDRLPQIEAFADLGEFFDRPLRTYSSGMHVRLGFAMFASFDPSVLIVDEALAVGDVSFQRKCFRRMEELLAGRDRSVLLVAHDLGAIQRLCDHVVWLDRGQIRKQGEPSEVITHYLRYMFSGDAPPATPVSASSPSVSDQERDANLLPQRGLLQPSPARITYPTEGATMRGTWLENASGAVVSSVSIEEEFFICYAVRFDRQMSVPVFGVRLVTTRGDVLFATNTLMMACVTKEYAASETQVVRWPVSPGLGAGDYFVSCGCSASDDPHHFYVREVDAYQFSVTGDSHSKGLSSLVGKPQLERNS